MERRVTSLQAGARRRTVRHGGFCLGSRLANAGWPNLLAEDRLKAELQQRASIGRQTNASETKCGGARRGFTLLEMIAVMAIIGVLAAALAPNALRSIDRAAIRSEAQTMQTLAASLEFYLIENGELPTTVNWPDKLANFTDRGAAAVLTNSRGLTRTLIFDPDLDANRVPRALLLSSMREGLIVPTSANINTKERFEDVWNTRENTLPSEDSWGGWGSIWETVDNSADYLIIQRVNFRPIYAKELKRSTIIINNTGDATRSYRLEDDQGAPLSAATLPAGATANLAQLARGDRLHFYSGSNYTSLVYSYIVVGDDRSFDYSDWIASAPPTNPGI